MSIQEVNPSACQTSCPYCGAICRFRCDALHHVHECGSCDHSWKTIEAEEAENQIAERYGFRFYHDRQFANSLWRIDGRWREGSPIPESVWNALIAERMARNATLPPCKPPSTPE